MEKQCLFYEITEKTYIQPPLSPNLGESGSWGTPQTLGPDCIGTPLFQQSLYVDKVEAVYADSYN